MGWWKINQKNRDKLTDLKIEQWKKNEKETNFRAVENSTGRLSGGSLTSYGFRQSDGTKLGEFFYSDAHNYLNKR